MRRVEVDAMISNIEERHTNNHLHSLSLSLTPPFPRPPRHTIDIPSPPLSSGTISSGSGRNLCHTGLALTPCPMLRIPQPTSRVSRHCSTDYGTGKRPRPTRGQNPSVSLRSQQPRARNCGLQGFFFGHPKLAQKEPLAIETHL